MVRDSVYYAGVESRQPGRGRGIVRSARVVNAVLSVAMVAWVALLVGMVWVAIHVLG